MEHITKEVAVSQECIKRMRNMSRIIKVNKRADILEDMKENMVRSVYNTKNN